MKRITKAANKKSHNSTSNEVDGLKELLKNRILECVSYTGFQHDKKSLTSLVTKAVFDKESSSALVIGPPGSGKTKLIQEVLEELSENKHFRKQAIIVKLNGLIHTDDRLSLLEMSRQMNLENVVDDKVTGTFAENLALLLECLRAKNQENSIIFILEEFCLFCSHHNQTLLYNLFDIAHSNKASVCVIGETSRMDVLELMEKRVKSRFSHRKIFLMIGSDDSAFEDRIDLCNNLLSLQPGDLEPSFVSDWNKSIKLLLKPKTVPYNIIRKLFDHDNREQHTRDFLLLLVSRLSDDYKFLEPEDFNCVFQDMTGDDRMRMAAGLSVLEMTLIIAMKHLVDIYQGEPLNFEMVYKRYQNFAKNHSAVGDVPREVIQKCYEHLQALELIIPVRGMAGSSRVQKQFQLHHFQLMPLQVKELIQNYNDLPTDIINWSNMNVV